MVGGMKVEHGHASAVSKGGSGRSVLLVGGGSGGHIYPNLAVVERLRETAAAGGMAVEPHLVVSDRGLDADIARGSGVGWTAVPASPLARGPRGLWRFVRDHRRGAAAVGRLLEQTGAGAVVCTGGFVSGPAVAAAARAGVPVALVSLDAVPGKANRWAARRAAKVFAAFAPPLPGAGLRGAEVVGYPLRRAAVGDRSAGGVRRAREHFGLDPARETLLVFAGSQGARTINRAMTVLAGGGGGGGPGGGGAMAGWQVLHVAGSEAGAAEALRSKYGAAGVAARVVAFCDRMDLAWAAADLGVTRAGAGTVAEAWANAVPCLMLPYPFHRDRHQRHNAAPLAAAGGAVVLEDLVDPAANATALRKHLAPLLRDGGKRAVMREALEAARPGDGAGAVARWVVERLNR